ncbi:putative olfactory receptor 1361-like [Scophthalmus maximus]|uniref:Putative olfactory receptor 1361-like n=1 Tax=Scophthalmus maximus TaxID=52904 RepID=A0A2U9B7S2_SCOMX|nr:olfactory receptor 1361-like [Scophthalmus maximus]AWO99818.1 putative olfactory receptor 1361-like [Scophthalmus maximus]
MGLFNSALGKNITFVHPAYFIISGLSGIPNVKHYYVFLFFVYIVSVLGNAAVMAVICLDHNLKTPKYIAVFNLAFVDLFGNTALVPKVLDIFLFNHHHVPFNDCLTFLFFCYTSLCMQSFNLVALSYDRLIAIIFPLHYQVRVTHRFMLYMIGSFWAFAVTAVLIAVGLITRLSFCGSVVVNSYFCDHGQIYRLSCNDHFPNYVLSCLYPVLIFWLPLAFILLTYLYIGCTLAKVATVQQGLKAFKTCIGHLSLVAVYFIPLLITFTLMENIHANARIINLSLTSVFPPMLNPIVYVLQTQEIKESLKRLFKIRGKSKRITAM